MARDQSMRNIDEPKFHEAVEAAPRQWEAALHVHSAVALAKLCDVTTYRTRRR